jgi:multidrug transporter EmrE-like cation transporter
MSFLYILGMTAAELFGNAHLKWYTERGHTHHFLLGIIGWAAVLFFLIQTLQKNSMTWTCIMWEAAIVLGGVLTAWIFFGEKLTHWIQWLGVLFALGAAICINWDCSDK